MNTRLLKVSALALALLVLATPMLQVAAAYYYHEDMTFRALTDFREPAIDATVPIITKGWGFVPYDDGEGHTVYAKVYSIMWDGSKDGTITVSWTEKLQPDQLIPDWAKKHPSPRIKFIISKYMYDKFGTLKVTIDVHMKPEYRQKFNELFQQLTGKTYDEWRVETAKLFIELGAPYALLGIEGVIDALVMLYGAAASLNLFGQVVYNPYHVELTFTGAQIYDDHVVVTMPPQVVNYIKGYLKDFYEIEIHWEYTSKGGKHCKWWIFGCEKQYDTVAVQPGIGIEVVG